jgi:hypothetical protein
MEKDIQFHCLVEEKFTVLICAYVGILQAATDVINHIKTYEVRFLSQNTVF